MKKNIYPLLLLLCILIGSCQEHIDFDNVTDYQIGDIVVKNGSIIPYNQYMVKSRDDAMAVIYITQHEIPELPSKALAIYIRELPYCTFSDTTKNYGCSTDTTAYNGYENTLKLRTSSSSSLVDRISYILPDLQNAFLPSVAEIRPLHKSFNLINTVLESVNGDPINANSPYCWYWTSTEINALDAYTYSPVSDLLLPSEKPIPYSVRPVFNVNY